MTQPNYIPTPEEFVVEWVAPTVFQSQMRADLAAVIASERQSAERATARNIAYEECHQCRQGAELRINDGFYTHYSASGSPICFCRSAHIRRAFPDAFAPFPTQEDAGQPATTETA